MLHLESVTNLKKKLEKKLVTYTNVVYTILYFTTADEYACLFFISNINKRLLLLLLLLLCDRAVIR